MTQYNKPEKTGDYEVNNNMVLVYQGQSMAHVVATATRLAQIDSTILISGESGTGKIMLANYIHVRSRRRDGPFISMNCAAMTLELMEEELFGSIDSNGDLCKKGMLEIASGGTLLLDEIETMPKYLQTRLLSTLQDKAYRPVGAGKNIPVDCRIICAANHELSKAVESDYFRQDLFYVINVFEIIIPPIRERTMDIIPLINALTEKYNCTYNKIRRFTKGALDILVRYSWPGNLREMDNTIERLVVMAPENMIDVYHLPDAIRFETLGVGSIPVNDGSLDAALEATERKMVLDAYEKTKSSYKVAQILNISQTRASRLIRKYGTPGAPGRRIKNN